MAVIDVTPEFKTRDRFQPKVGQQIKIRAKPTVTETLIMKLSILRPSSLSSLMTALMSHTRFLSRHLRSSSHTSSSLRNKTCLWFSSSRKMSSKLRRIARSSKYLRKPRKESWQPCQRLSKKTSIALTKSSPKRRCWRCRQVRKVMETFPTPLIKNLRSRSVK